MAFRQFIGTIDSTGNGIVDIYHNNVATEWDIFQISVSCGNMGNNCIVQLAINGAFLCATPQGSLDTATGPPDVVLNSADKLTAQWINGVFGDPLTVNIWFNEHPVGTTRSTAH